MTKPRRLSDDLDALLAVPEQPEPQPQRRLDLDANGCGELQTAAVPISTPLDDDFYADELRALGFDPAHYRVEHGVRISVWEVQVRGGGTQTLRSVRARIVPRIPGVDPIDADALIAEIKRHKPRKRPAPSGDSTFCIVVGDLQVGKGDNGPDGGSGTEASVGRYLSAIDDAIIRVKNLRRAGIDLGHLLVLGVGDLVEGWGHYANQTWSNELDRREQVRVTRRLLIDGVGRLSREFGEVTVAAVAGNHGEHRNVSGGGSGKFKYGTQPSDNDDLACWEQACEVLSANPDVFGHIRWHIGGDPLIKQVEASGWIVGITHGHIVRESGNPEQKLRRWYERQAAGGDIHPHILVTGHYHHLRVASWGDRDRRGCIWLQAPSTDSSDYFAASTGEASRPGVLSFVIQPDVRVTDIAIL